MPPAPKPGGSCQWAQPVRGTPAGPLGSRAEAAGAAWARDRAPRWFRDLGFDPSPTRGARNHGANLPGGDLIPTYLKTVRFSRTQALHTPHFCPRVPPKSLGPIGATVQMRPLHRGAGLQLNTVNVTRSYSWGDLGPAGKPVRKEGGRLGCSERRIPFPRRDDVPSRGDRMCTHEECWELGAAEGERGRAGQATCHRH